jgi:cyclin H
LTRFEQATAIQFLKRFYTSNSLMTYHPTDILKTALYFATKTENFSSSLRQFAEAIGETKAEDVLASEFLLTQALLFTFDVRHPFRALKGAFMELQAMANNDLPALPGGEVVGNRPANMEQRAKNAYMKATEYLRTSALLTDVYFHFTPSQIMMASLLIADRDLTEWYLAAKFPSTSQESVGMKAKVLATLRWCADMLKAVDPSLEPSAVEKKELRALSKKLKKCRNPEKMDLAGLQRAKREGEDVGDEKIVKKRKLERENYAKEADGFFGPELTKQ